MLITRTCAYTNMRMRVDGGGGATCTYIYIAMASRDEFDQLLFESVVRGYHVCKTVWTIYVRGGDPYRRPRDCRPTRCMQRVWERD